jgi:hypothetical protein
MKPWYQPDDIARVVMEGPAPSYHGYTMQAVLLKNGEIWIEILKNGSVVRQNLGGMEDVRATKERFFDIADYERHKADWQWTWR